MSKVKGLITASLAPLIDQDITHGSITPRTLVSRDFGNAALNSGQSTVYTPKPDDFFVEEYTHVDSTSSVVKSHVLRFGINSYVHQGIQPPNLLSTPGAKSSISSGNPKQKLAALVTECQAFSSQCITPQEKYLCETAISYLNNPSTTEVAVVLDIFVRNPDGSIKYEQKTDPSNSGQVLSVPETHSVVLYKQSNSTGSNDFLVIDPSNSSFSYILTTTHPDLKLCFSIDPIKIYKANGPTGPGLDQWRECVDAAVKIGFGLAYHKDKILVDAQGIAAESLMQSVSVQEVSNNCKSDSLCLPKVVQELPARSLQSSDKTEAGLAVIYFKQSYKLIALINNIMSTSGINPMHLVSLTNQKYDPKNILTKQVPHVQCVSELKALCTKLTDLKRAMEQNPGFIYEQECATHRRYKYSA